MVVNDPLKGLISLGGGFNWHPWWGSIPGGFNPFENISQIGSFPEGGVKNKSI